MPRDLHSARYGRLRELLIEARLQAGLTQKDLAKKLCRPQSFVTRYETAESRIDVVEFLLISEMLQIDFAKIMTDVKKLAAEASRPDMPPV